jgi:Tol biopolymer transport system component
VAPAFSPDGKKVAFAWNGEKRDNFDIYVKRIGSAEAHRLTTDPGIDDFPAWSPDGREIAFVRVPRESVTGAIHVISPLGGSDRKLSDQTVARGRLSWSPDGQWLATAAYYYANEAGSDIRGIRLIEASSGAVRSITTPTGSTYHTFPAFSPDGRHLAYLSCIGRYSCQIDSSG